MFYRLSESVLDNPHRWALAVLALVVAIPAVCLIPTARRIDAASATLLECQYRDANGHWRGNGACLQSSLLAITGAVKATGGAIVKAAPEIAAAVKDTARNSAAASQKTGALMDAGAVVVTKLGGTADAATQAVQDLDGAIRDLDAAVRDVALAAQPLLSSADATVRSAGGALEQLTALEQQLGAAIKADNEKAIEILAQMLQVLKDPDIKSVMDNVAAATGSGAEILKSVDLSTRWMRQKVALIKAILTRLLGFVKVTVSPF